MEDDKLLLPVMIHGYYYYQLHCLYYFFLQHTLTGHTAKVFSAKFMDDGQRVVRLLLLL